MLGRVTCVTHYIIRVTVANHLTERVKVVLAPDPTGNHENVI